MDRRTAKELLHIREWCQRCALIVASGRDAYVGNPVLHEAGDALLMKIGEAARRLDRIGFPEPPGIRWSDAIANRNWLIHQYDHIDRDLTWNTLSHDIPAWTRALQPSFIAARRCLNRVSHQE